MSQHIMLRQYRDFSSELSAVRINVPAMTALTIATILGEIANMETSLDAVTIGVASESVITLDRTVISAALPASAFAQRELKWLVRYHSNTLNHKFTLEIPTADPVGAPLIPGTDLADLSVTPWTTFKTNFEIVAVAPDDDTDQVTIDSITLVGRNL